MSRTGKQIIIISEKNEASKAEVAGGVNFTIKGPKGTLSRVFKKDIEITIAGNQITLAPIKADELASRALWGTYASHIKNMVLGVNTPYEKKLIREGVGFKSEVAGNSLNLALGFSHLVKVPIPAGIEVKAEKNVITFTGIDKESVTGFAAKVRAMKKPEPYKGKGMRYHDEVIRRKQGKKSA